MTSRNRVFKTEPTDQIEQLRSRIEQATIAAVDEMILIMDSRLNEVVEDAREQNAPRKARKRETESCAQ